MAWNFVAGTLAVAFLLASSRWTSAAESANAPQRSNTARRAQSRFPKPDLKYQHGPDSQRKEGVPRGKLTDYQWQESKVYTNTIRHYSIYVPAQYDASKPAALMGLSGWPYLPQRGW